MKQRADEGRANKNCEVSVTLTNSLRALLLVLTVVLVGFAPAPFPKADRRNANDPTDVGGLWAFERYDMNGQPYDQGKNDYTIEMGRDKFTFVPRTGGSTTYVMRLDPAASPPAFTWSMQNNVMFVGSYRLQRDQITMIFKYGNNVAQRPTDFAGRPEYHYVMRRIRR